MTRTHTPGPWRIGDAGNTIFGPPNGQPSPQRIADLAIIDHKANGRLIAAAPELLEAARAFLPENTAPHDITGAQCAALRAAIARADGTTTTTED